MSQQPYYATNDIPVVVQGTVVKQHQQQGYAQGLDQGNTTYNHGQPQQQGRFQDEDDNWTKGEHQPKRCNDMLFGIIFYAHLGVIAWCTATYAPILMTSLREAQDQSANGQRFLMRFLDQNIDNQQATDDAAQVIDDMNHVLFLLGTSGVVGFFISSLTLGFMMNCAECLIKSALFFNIITSLLVAVIMLLAGVILVAIGALFMFAFSLYYAYYVWARIPFAAANMTTAITAIRANIGVTFFAYVSLILTFLWSIWWSIAFSSALYVTSGCNDAAGNCENEGNRIISFLFFLSYYWTVQVSKNVVHVTVAGTVGTWWFEPRTASSCCSRGVRDSWLRAMTFSFGSICFGSLLVAIIQAIKSLIHQMREQGDGIVACLAECLLGCIESLVEYFNTWAFTYVGLYGYSFMEAGKNVMTLFRSRGWTTIITDNLVDSALGMVSFGVGIMTGVVILLVAVGTGIDLGGGAIPFGIGFLVGAILSLTLFSVVSSAVNTVIVCYAEAPSEFQSNHPRLSDHMRDSWRQAWPSEFHY